MKKLSFLIQRYVGDPVRKHVLRNFYRTANKDKDLYSRLITNAPRNVRFREGPDSYNFTNRTVSSSGHPEALAHELGHHDIHKKWLGRLTQNGIERELPIGVALAAVPAGVVAGRREEDHTRRDLSIGAAASAPLLASEAGASFAGHRLMRAAGASPAALRKYNLQMLKVFGTYASVPAIAAAEYGIAKHLSRKYHER